jgi:hypothetical protein
VGQPKAVSAPALSRDSNGSRPRFAARSAAVRILNAPVCGRVLMLTWKERTAIARHGDTPPAEDDDRQRGSRAAGTRYLFIVSREQESLYEYLLQQFSEEPDRNVKIILDRRSAQRRTRTDPVVTERRAADRRTSPEVDIQLRTQSVVIVTDAPRRPEATGRA